MSKNLLKGEFIGLLMEVKDADNPTLIGTEGEIVDETKNSFIVSTESGNKTLLKSQIRFIVSIDGKKVLVDGRKLCFRPEERVKKIR